MKLLDLMTITCVVALAIVVVFTLLAMISYKFSRYSDRIARKEYRERKAARRQYIKQKRERRKRARAHPQDSNIVANKRPRAGAKTATKKVATKTKEN